ncbi:Fumarate hydratase class II [Streptomyces californicus]
MVDRSVPTSTDMPGTASEGDGFRIEHDSMGEVRVPAHAKWRAQTQRAVENFPVSGQRLERAHIEALARIKGAAARVNAELKVLDPDIATAIQEAAEEVAAGRRHDHFPVDVFQTGSGTSSNMNANEVIATLATERLGRPVHPNDHVNASEFVERRLPVLHRHRGHRRRHRRPDPGARSSGRFPGGNRPNSRRS